MSEPFDYGHFDIVLADYLRVNGISKNQLSDKANLQRTQLNSYCKNNDHHAVGSFRRSYKQNDEIYDWTQYVATLCKKPRAMENTRFFHQMPQQWQTYLASTQGKERKNALQLLSEIVNDGNANLCDDALELAAQNGRTDTDSLRQCYYMVAKKEYRPDPLQLTSGPMLNYNPNLSIYDGLMGGDAHG